MGKVGKGEEGIGRSGLAGRKGARKREEASAAGKARKKGKRTPVEKEAPWCV